MGNAGSWEHEKSRRALKWREERRKESYTKEDSEKDSDTGDEPDNLEPPEVASARENIAALVGEQKRLRKEKVYGAWGQRAGEEGNPELKPQILGVEVATPQGTSYFSSLKWEQPW